MAKPHVDDGQMTVVEHLVELRRRLLRCAIALGIGGVIAWLAYPQIFDLLIEPYCRSLSTEARADSGGLIGPECRLLQSDPLEGFAIRFTIAAYGGFALAIPVILWQAWRFVAPGLYEHERRYAIPFVVSGVALFALGAALAYWTIPRALTFLNEIGGADLVQVYSPRPYVDFVTKMMIAFGLGFQFPIVLCFLQMMRMVTPQKLRQGWRYAVVGITILVAVITPSGDPVTLLVLSVPMYIFYELSILYGKFWQRRHGPAAQQVAP